MGCCTTDANSSPLVALDAAVDALMGCDLDLPAEVIDADVIALDALRSRLAAVAARYHTRWVASLAWARDGSLSPTAALARRGRIDVRTARRQTTRASRLLDTPVVAAAFAAGELSVDQVDLLVGVRTFANRLAFARDEQQLVDHARQLDVAALAKVVKYWKQLADDDLTEDRAQRHRAERHVHINPSFDDSYVIGGRLDAIDGAIVATELRRLERLLFEQDWADLRAEHGDAATKDRLARTPAQRRADALRLMAERSAAHDDAQARPARVLLSVYVDYPTLAGRICELANGTVVTPGQVAGLLSAADIERVVFDGPSRVIDLGVRDRFFTGGLRRAIELRDRHCTHPGCTVPAHDCHVDHIVEHAAGGPTTQANGRLLCPKHNRQRPGRHPAAHATGDETSVPTAADPAGPPTPSPSRSEGLRPDPARAGPPPPAPALRTLTLMTPSGPRTVTVRPWSGVRPPAGAPAGPSRPGRGDLLWTSTGPPRIVRYTAEAAAG